MADVRDVSGDDALACARVDAKRIDCAKPCLAEAREITALVHEENNCAMAKNRQAEELSQVSIAFRLKGMTETQ